MTETVLREALEWYAKDYDHALGCSQWDGGARARSALAATAETGDAAAMREPRRAERKERTGLDVEEALTLDDLPDQTAGRASEIYECLSCCAQILDVVKHEWSAESAWSEWDQSVRDKITASLAILTATKPQPSGTASVRDGIAAIINDRTMINDEGFVQNSEFVADLILKGLPDWASSFPAVTDEALGNLLAEICSHSAVDEAMQDAWNDICSDTGCHPLDLEHGRGKHLTFKPNHWANQIAKRLFVRAIKLRLATSPLTRPVSLRDGPVLNEPQTFPMWQPIETAPKDNPIMLCVEGYLPSVGRWWPVDSCWASFDWVGHFDSDKEMTDYVNGTSYEPTHWMPLPAGPSLTRPEHS